MENKQDTLFNVDETWREEWKDMPEFVQNDLMPWKSIVVHFETKEDRKDFAKLVSQNITSETKSIWYPAAKIAIVANKRYVDEP